MVESLAKKLLMVQKNIGAVSKDKVNPYFSSNYADINKYIEVVKPILSDAGLVLLQPTCEINGQLAVRTIIIDSDNGESVEWVTPIALKDNDPQKAGSAITYYRRYALQSTLFVEAEDDDANKASRGKKKTGTVNPFPQDVDPLADED